MSEIFEEKPASDSNESVVYTGVTFKDLTKPKASAKRLIFSLVLAVISFALAVHKTIYSFGFHVSSDGNVGLTIYYFLINLFIIASAVIIITGFVHYVRAGNANVTSVAFLLLAAANLLIIIELWPLLVAWLAYFGYLPISVIIPSCFVLNVISFFKIRKGEGKRAIPIIACTVNFVLFSISSFLFMLSEYPYFFLPELFLVLSLFVFVVKYRRGNI